MSRALLLASVAIAAALLPLGTASAADRVQPFVQPFDWTGFYAGIHGGLIRGDVKLSEDSAPTGGNISGVIGGVLAGYNFRHAPGPYLWGVEADFGTGDVHGNGVVCEGDCSLNIFHYDLEWDAHFRLRLGMPNGPWMPFVAGGIALAKLNITEGSAPLWDDLYTGGTIGAGIDALLGPHIVARGEVLYDFYPTQTRDEYSASLSAWTARLALIYQLP